ncbi:hypothetical protein [Bacillus thuringiensis]
MDEYSKVILSNGNEYIVPVECQELIEKECSNQVGEIYNKFIRIQHIDVGTGNTIQLVLNPQQIVAIEEVKFKRGPHIPSIFRNENK